MAENRTSRRAGLLREHRFDCKVNKALFLAANQHRKDTWPNLVEKLFRKILSDAGVRPEHVSIPGKIEWRKE